jgi:(1->4)-alpha-D-glucan 1-alpha-D-glucosylmutase
VFPVYRTYVRADAGVAEPADEAAVASAVREARARRPDLGPDLIDFLASVLTLSVRGPLESELAMRFQQLTSAVMAKGIEDTALYRYARLLSLNEVGADPATFGTDVDAFHLANIEAQRRWPASMLATSTHDTKRSEDVRARLHVLSELPDAWDAAARRWSGMNARHRRHDLPDRNTEWFLYQTLVGAWPIDLERLQGAMLKSVREQKVHTAWTRPDEAYEGAVAEFIEAIMDDPEFRTEVDRFVERIAEPARLTSLSMALLKLTAVGVPDIYQGTELWAHHLVDPDNRRAVDFELVQRLLGEAAVLGPGAALQRPLQGLPKVWLIMRALAVRSEHPAAFGPQSTYRPIRGQGSKADHVVAFSRADQVVVVAPRLLRGLGSEWGDTTIELPQGDWLDRLGEQRWTARGPIRLGDLLSDFPLALLVREPIERARETV